MKKPPVKEQTSSIGGNLKVGSAVKKKDPEIVCVESSGSSEKKGKSKGLKQISLDNFMVKCQKRPFEKELIIDLECESPKGNKKIKVF